MIKTFDFEGVKLREAIFETFVVVIKEMQIFLEPVFKAIVYKEEWKKNWTFKQKWNG